MIEYKVKNKITVPDYSDFKFGGEIGKLFDRFIDKRMTSDFARNEILKEAENAFFERKDDENPPIGMWRGEFWGKLMISASRACRYTGDEKLKKIIRDSVYKIISTAEPDGYIGSYKNAEQIFACPYSEGAKIMGWRCNWCWNIWCRKYTLWGLLEAYLLLEEKDILDAAVKFTDQLIDMLQKLDITILDTGTFYGVASGSILKPIILLYRLTENERYLNFAVNIANGFEDGSNTHSQLLLSSLEKKPIHFWNRHMDPGNNLPISVASHKAYETMSCFDGLAELYRVTGNEKYLIAVENFYELLMEYEFNTLKSVGFNDLFLFANAVQDAASEPCDIIHFMRVTSELYQITGNHKYIETLESTFENAFLASVKRDGTWGARTIRGISNHESAPSQCNLKYNHCCVNNMPRGFLNVGECIAVTDTENVFVNLYTPSEVTLQLKENQLVKVTIGDGYLQYGKVIVKANAHLTADCHIALRIPAWCKSATVTNDADEAAGSGGPYAIFPLKNGENTFKLEFDLTPRIVERPYFRDFYPLTEYMKSRYFNKFDKDRAILYTKENMATLEVGPLLLALSKQTGITDEDMFDRSTVFGKGYTCMASPKPVDGVRCAFEITLENGENTMHVLMCDYAFASNRFKERDFSIFI